jgi:hypothetical protein
MVWWWLAYLLGNWLLQRKRAIPEGMALDCAFVSTSKR